MIFISYRFSLRIFTWFLFALTFLACQDPTEEKNNQSDANHHMNQGDFEDLVKRFESPEREKWQKPQEVIEKLGNIEGKTIADIGAGSGYFSFRLAEQGAKVIAKDVDERFINYIKQKKKETKTHLIKAELVQHEDPLMDENEVDAAISVNTYHHIENRIDYFRKVLKGIKPGGSLLVVDFKKEETPHGPPVEMRISGFDVIKELQKAGFSKTIIETTTLNEQYIIKATKAEEV